MVRWHWRWQGTAFLIFSVTLVLYSMLSVFGFMSARMVMTQSHEAVVAMQQGQLDWTRNSSMKRDLPKQERQLLHKEANALSKEIVTSLSIIPDAQAASIASALNLPVAKVQQWLVMISSGTAQAIKFLCLLGSVMMWPSRARTDGEDNKTHSNLGGEGGVELGMPQVVHSEPIGFSRSFQTQSSDLDAKSTVSPPDLVAEVAVSPSELETKSTASSPELVGKCAVSPPDSENLWHKSDDARSTHQSVLSTDAPKGKLSHAQLHEYLKRELTRDQPSSSYAIARATGWSQSAVYRKLRRMRGSAVQSRGAAGEIKPERPSCQSTSKPTPFLS